LQNVSVSIYTREIYRSYFTKTDQYGSFSLKHLPRYINVELRVGGPRMRKIMEIPALSGDKDLGEIPVKFSVKPPSER
jgi:hypothetical protein